MDTEYQSRLEEATTWWTRFQELEPREEDVSAWLAWLEADTRNAECFKQVNELAERLRYTQASAPERLGPLQLPMSAAILAKARIPFWKLAVAASVVIAVVIIGVGTLALDRDNTDSHLYSTGTGAQRMLLLPDGSQVVMGGSSTIDVVFSADQRQVRLSAGEAYFEVKPEAANRPFIVDGGIATVRALGTAFNVRRNEQRLAVTVTEGRVQVVQAAGNAMESLAAATGLHRPSATEIGRAQQVILEPESSRLKVTTADPRQATAWREGRLQFADEPLDVVIDNVSRYSDKPLRAVDPKLHAITYTGTFVPGHLESWLGALEKMFDVTVKREGDALIVATRPDAS